ncbi:polysaccharide deacetylase family protein [Polluticaenibacter yanchengensis]|uniref:Polysaccharide deacetylase family protein n=1 Tax=Polluticaenibacter yanchengensis TaxID=3014562 RepID=A0ABT4UHB1_9BACT|nr:polysaccharide deacetylase family protein [Chitinophagaceae bacterium LY-5]
MENSIHINPYYSFIYDDSLKQVTPECVVINQLPVIFADRQNREATVPFDIFSAVFFMVSRYEEYFDYRKDRYGRFLEKYSFTGQHGLTKTPLVDRWCFYLKQVIATRCNIQLPATAYKVTYTFDIDVAYAFRGRSLLRNILSLGKDFTRLNFRNVLTKLRFATGNIPDPFDTYDFIAKTGDIDKKFFFLLAGKKQHFNHNLSPASPALKKLIKKIAQDNDTGIHPSYYTPADKVLLAQEINTLGEITNQPVTISRQHYLRLAFPCTYQNLADCGIEHDYSLMYAEQPGFRAGTAYSYPFFNVAANKATQLMIHPACVMDSMFRDDLKLPASESIAVYQLLLEAIKQYGGNMICIWHNDLLALRTKTNDPLNFRKIYIDFLESL